jgi:hypothetical protein
MDNKYGLAVDSDEIKSYREHDFAQPALLILYVNGLIQAFENYYNYKLNPGPTLCTDFDPDKSIIR